MQIKKYRGNTLKEAITLMKDDLGDEAIVLSTKVLEDEDVSRWLSVFNDVSQDVSVIERFFRVVYQDNMFNRVKGENPPDWTRFKTFSSTPDHSDLRHVLKLTREEMASFGHQKDDFILQCMFASQQCRPRYCICDMNINYIVIFFIALSVNYVQKTLQTFCDCF